MNKLFHNNEKLPTGPSMRLSVKTGPGSSVGQRQGRTAGHRQGKAQTL